MKLASIERIKEVTKHPNADLLDIVAVLNYKAIVKKDSYKVNDLIVFIQPDTVLPDKEWAQFYKAKSSRVKAIKLRNVWSFGIVESLFNVGFNGDFSNKEGEDISDLLGITKYEPPVPQDLQAKGSLPFDIPKTDEERYQNLLAIPYNEIVDVTLKVDGSSFSVYCKKLPDESWSTGITGRTLELKTDCENKYTIIAKKYDLLDKFEKYCRTYNVSLVLRGEMYGNGIQNFKTNPHATKPLGIAFFSVYNIDNRLYEGTESPHYYENVCSRLGLETVPMLEKGVVLTPELIKKYDEDLETIAGTMFEGVVIKLRNGESFKVINKHYDAKK